MAGSKTGGLRSKRRKPGITGHPGALGSVRRLVKLCRMGRIEREFMPRLSILALMNLVSSPLRALEKLRYAAQLQSTPMHPSPVFILGHWRSGTTHLLNLLSQDLGFGFLDGFQAIAPGFCLIGRGGIKNVLKRIVEPRNRTRPMDRIPFSLDAPQEEELALANTTVHSFSHAFVLPKKAAWFFDRYVLFDGITERAKAEWTKEYVQLLWKVSMAAGGKRLLLKNVTNTTRIPELLELFPDAKFVYIHRSPYDVYASTVHLHDRLMSICQLQQVSDAKVKENVLSFYERFMRKYLSDRSRIPEGNLVEIRYDDLVQSPMDVLREIYKGLRLGGFDKAEPAIRAYIESIRDYKRNRHTLNPAEAAAISARWRFAFDEWDYPLTCQERDPLKESPIS